MAKRQLFCTECRAEVEKADKFCVECGASTVGEDRPRRRTSSRVARAPQKQAPQSGEAEIRVALAAGAVVLLGLLFLFGKLSGPTLVEQEQAEREAREAEERREEAAKVLAQREAERESAAREKARLDREEAEARALAAKVDSFADDILTEWARNNFEPLARSGAKISERNIKFFKDRYRDRAREVTLQLLKFGRKAKDAGLDDSDMSEIQAGFTRLIAAMVPPSDEMIDMAIQRQLRAKELRAKLEAERRR